MTFDSSSPIPEVPEIPVLSARAERRRRRAKRLRSFAIFLVVTSCVLYVMIPIVPFLNMDREQKASVALTLFIASEVTFWSAAPILGKEFITKIRQWLSPKKWLTIVKRAK